MRATLFLLLAVGIVISGCSKKSAANPQAAAVPEPGVNTPAAPAQDNAMIVAGLEELNRKVQQQQYDAAVGSLVSMAQMPKSDKQEAEYRARLRETETALLKRAQQGDAAAQQSAQMLGRMMTGR